MSNPQLTTCPICAQPSDNLSPDGYCLRHEAQLRNESSDRTTAAPTVSIPVSDEDREADRRERQRIHARRLHRAERALAEIPDLMALLELFVLPGTGSEQEGVGSRPHPGSRPPVDLDVVDLRDRYTKNDERRTETVLADAEAHARRQGVLPTLTSWVRDVDEHLDGTDGYDSPWTRRACCAACSRDWVVADARAAAQVGCCTGPFRDHPWVPRTIVGECGFLRRHLPWLAEQQQFAECADDLDRIHRDLSAATHLPRATTRYTCTDCGWDVQPKDNGTWYSCTGCKRAWTEVELHRMAERRRPKPLLECATRAGVSVRSLRTAVAQKRLRPAARDGNTDLFALDDVMPVAAQIKLNRTATRA